MLAYALLLLLALTLDLPYEADAWPLDDGVIRQVEIAAPGGWGVNAAVAYEQGQFLRAHMVLIGMCEGDGPVAASRYGPCETSVFATERCLKGACPETVSLHRPTGVGRGGIFDMPLGSRPLDWSSPEPGRRYLLLGRADSQDPGLLWGSFGHQRYELSDGIVVSKGVSESEFLALVEALLDAPADSEGCTQESAGAVVQPPN